MPEFVQNTSAGSGVADINNTDTVIIIGATSAVAQSLIRLHAKQGDHLILVGRDQAKLDIVKADASALGASSCEQLEGDFANIESLDAVFQSISDQIGNNPAPAVNAGKRGTELWYCFHGLLPDQKACELSWTDFEHSLNVNCLSILKLLGLIANRLEPAQAGKIVVVSSVAGMRGRQSNYVYGTAKGALNIYLQGLRNRLSKANVSVMTVLPGFIKTPMTEGLDRDGPLWATPEKVADDIFKAQKKGRDVIYSPWFWRIIMLVIRSIPERIFKRLSL